MVKKQLSGIKGEISKNKDIYGLAISVLALVFSQFPPLYTYNYKPIFELHARGRLLLLDKMGKLEFQIPISIINTGKSSGNIYDIKSAFIDSEKKEIVKTMRVDQFMSIDSNIMIPSLEKWDNFIGLSVTLDSPWLKTCSFKSEDSIENDIDIITLIEDIKRDQEDEFLIIEDELGDDDYELKMDKQFEHQQNYKLKPEHKQRLADILKKTYKWIEAKDYQIVFYTITKEKGETKISSLKLYRIDVNKEFLDTYYRQFIKYERPFVYELQKRNLFLEIQEVNDKEIIKNCENMIIKYENIN